MCSFRPDPNTICRTLGSKKFAVAANLIIVGLLKKAVLPPLAEAVLRNFYGSPRCCADRQEDQHQQRDCYLSQGHNNGAANQKCNSRPAAPHHAVHCSTPQTATGAANGGCQFEPLRAFFLSCFNQPVQSRSFAVFLGDIARRRIVCNSTRSWSSPSSSPSWSSSAITARVAAGHSGQSSRR